MRHWSIPYFSRVRFISACRSGAAFNSNFHYSFLDHSCNNRLSKREICIEKTARKNKARIYELDDPVRIYQIFAKPFYFLIPMMMGLGVLLRYYNEYLGGYVVVAAIYCGIGMALIVSSRTYWAKKPTASAPDNS